MKVTNKIKYLVSSNFDSISLSIDLMSHDQSDHAANHGPPSDDLTKTNKYATNDKNNNVQVVMLLSIKTLKYLNHSV